MPGHRTARKPPSLPLLSAEGTNCQSAHAPARTSLAAFCCVRCSKTSRSTRSAVFLDSSPERAAAWDEDAGSRGGRVRSVWGGSDAPPAVVCWGDEELGVSFFGLGR